MVKNTVRGQATDHRDLCRTTITFFKNCNMAEAIQACCFFTGVVAFSAKSVNGRISGVIQQIKAPPSLTLPLSHTG